MNPAGAARLGFRWLASGGSPGWPGAGLDRQALADPDHLAGGTQFGRDKCDGPLAGSWAAGAG
jgi:hypothetical protein